MYANRIDAGHRLAERLRHLRGDDVVVLGLPRGGVPVAAIVADALDAPLDVLLVRKLGAPFQPELAMGALGEDGVIVLNDEVLRYGRVTAEDVQAVARREQLELDRRSRLYRGARSAIPLSGRTVLIVDDGIATGSTAKAACRVARQRGATRVILAAPVGAPGAADRFTDDADEVIVLESPRWLNAVGQAYQDFAATADDEVVDLLTRADRRTAAADTRGLDEEVDIAAGTRGLDEEIDIAAGNLRLEGRLTVPPDASGIVVFAHGSGSSRHSPRNQYVASALNRAGLGTLLLDLLTTSEEIDRSNVFDISLLAGRLGTAVDWLRQQPGTSTLAVGLFGASTGAGAALWAAAEPDADIAAVVSRGGRPDLAGPRLAAVRAPTLLIVGGNDPVVLDLNQRALAQLRCPSELRVVPGAGHLFEEPGTLVAVADLASDWFVRHLTPDRRARLTG